MVRKAFKIFGSWLRTSGSISHFFHLFVPQHPVRHVPHSFLERHLGVVVKEVRGRAVADGHVRAGPHHSCRLVARIESRQPQRLRTVPPHGITVVLGAEVFVGGRVVHVVRHDSVGLCVQPGDLEGTISPTLILFLRNIYNYLEPVVSMGGEKSSFLNINTGVPQGAVLGPIVFLYTFSDTHRG